MYIVYCIIHIIIEKMYNSQHKSPFNVSFSIWWVGDNLMVSGEEEKLDLTTEPNTITNIETNIQSEIHRNWTRSRTAVPFEIVQGCGHKVQINTVLK